MFTFIPGSIQRRFVDLGNWVNDYVEPEQTPRAFNLIVEHVRANYSPPTPAPFSVPEPPRLRSIINPAPRPAQDQFVYRLDVYGLYGKHLNSILFSYEGARDNITKILRENRGTKVILILVRNMEGRVDGKKKTDKCYFQPNIQINLAGTN